VPQLFFAFTFFIKISTHNLPIIFFIRQHTILLQTRKEKTGEKNIMANKSVVPEAKEALNRFKMEAANEVGVNLKQGYNGDLTSKQAGSIGGQMVKKMIESYENSMK